MKNVKSKWMYGICYRSIDSFLEGKEYYGEFRDAAINYLKANHRLILKMADNGELPEYDYLTDILSEDMFLIREFAIACRILAGRYPYAIESKIAEDYAWKYRSAIDYPTLTEYVDSSRFAEHFDEVAKAAGSDYKSWLEDLDAYNPFTDNRLVG